MTHDVTMEIVPKDQMLYPVKTFSRARTPIRASNSSGSYLSDMIDQIDPGSPPTPELKPPKDPRRGFDAKYVAGKPVLQTVVEARNFLAADPSPPV
ncbi:hypothetical protein [Nocardia suismassiliense]|uniref:hypothetical protein n=1 Tax=Nocardia suismassiliense TaxID=2077092 RepID=UPI00131EE035|nr:hypothetical protein [Nocardia suismassiliense]